MLYRLLLDLWRVAPLPERLRWLVIRWGNAHFLAGAAALILDEHGRVLLFKHTYRRRHPWGLPGGWIGRGERAEEGLVRELREEGGLDIVVERLLLADMDPRYRHIDFVYLCRIAHGTFRPSAEVDAYTYTPPDRLPDIHATQRDQIARALRIAGRT